MPDLLTPERPPLPPPPEPDLSRVRADAERLAAIRRASERRRRGVALLRIEPGINQPDETGLRIPDNG